MRILLVGAGGVGTAFARIAARRPFAELIIADYDLARAQRAAAAKDSYAAVQLDARDEAATAALLTEHRCDALMNATDPRFVMPLFRAALAAGVNYLDMAMSLSHPHPAEPYAKTGVKLGDEQFAMAERVGAGRQAGPGRHRRRAGPVRRVRPLRGRRAVQRDRRARRPGRREPGRGRLRLRADLLHLDHDRGVPQPAGDLGERPRLVHHAAVQRAGDLQLPGRHRPGRVRERRARGGAADAALGRRPSGSPSNTASARSSSASCRRCTSSAWTGPTRSASAAPRSRRATWSPPACPTRPRSATR